MTQLIITLIVAIAITLTALYFRLQQVETYNRTGLSKHKPNQALRVIMALAIASAALCGLLIFYIAILS